MFFFTIFNTVFYNPTYYCIYQLFDSEAYNLPFDQFYTSPKTQEIDKIMNTISHDEIKQKQNHNPFKASNKSKSLTSVRHLLTELDIAGKKRHHSQNKKQICLDRQEIRKQMKKNWKDPGYCNVQFSKNKALKGKFLNDWEISRIFMATRSYQTPKQYKGFKQTIQSREFPKVSKQAYSLKFQNYLSTIEQKNEGFMFSPKKKMHTEAYVSSNRDIKRTYKLKNTFQAFTTQNKSFGMGTVTWKSGQNKTFKTLEN